MYSENTLKKYSEDLASKLPAPGGGSAAAYCGALGVACLQMVCNFTIGNDKYKHAQQDAARILSSLAPLRTRLIDLVDEDVKAYGKVASAQKIPKEEKEKRAKAMQEALKEAGSVPLEICRISHQAIKECVELAEKGNKNLITDVGVGVNLLAASFKSAKLNVEENLKYIKDEKFILEARKMIEPLEAEVASTEEAVSAKVKEMMAG